MINICKYTYNNKFHKLAIALHYIDNYSHSMLRAVISTVCTDPPQSLINEIAIPIELAVSLGLSTPIVVTKDNIEQLRREVEEGKAYVLKRRDWYPGASDFNYAPPNRLLRKMKMKNVH